MLCTVRESPPTGAQGTRTWSPLRGGAGHLTSPVHTRESIGSLGPPHLSITCITPVYLPSRLSVRTRSPQACPWPTTAPRGAPARASLAAMGAQTTGCAATATIPAEMLALPSHPVGEFPGPGDSDLTRPRALASRTHELLATVLEDRDDGAAGQRLGDLYQPLRSHRSTESSRSRTSRSGPRSSTWATTPPGTTAATDARHRRGGWRRRGPRWPCCESADLRSSPRSGHARPGRGTRARVPRPGQASGPRRGPPRSCGRWPRRRAPRPGPARVARG